MSTAQVQQLREWSAASAPVQALRHQYNQKCDPHRYEYLMFADHEAGAGLADAVKQALIAPVSAELETSESFCIVSEAGSRDQPWHTDSIPSETLARGKWSSSLHYIGVLTPLADTDDVCGRTEVSISSHTTLGDGSTAAGRTAKLSLKVGDCLGTLLVMRPRLFALCPFALCSLLQLQQPTTSVQPPCNPRQRLQRLSPKSSTTACCTPLRSRSFLLTHLTFVCPRVCPLC